MDGTRHVEGAGHWLLLQQAGRIRLFSKSQQWRVVDNGSGGVMQNILALGTDAPPGRLFPGESRKPAW